MSRIVSMVRKTEFVFVAHLDNGMMRAGIVDTACRDLPAFSVPADLDDDQFCEFVSSKFKTGSGLTTIGVW